MNQALHRTFAFAGTAFVVLLLADLAVWGGYQGMHPRDELPSQLIMHGAMHVSVLVLSVIGAAVAFFFLRRRLPSTKVASVFGAVFATLSFFAIVAAFTAAGFIGAGAWLLLGSATIALLCGLIAGRNEG
jgi:hypothetical protein